MFAGLTLIEVAYKGVTTTIHLVSLKVQTKGVNYQHRR